MLSALLRYPLGCRDRGNVDRSHVSSTDAFNCGSEKGAMADSSLLPWSRVGGRWCDILK